MGEPRAITYKEVRKAHGTDAGAVDVWHRIGDMTGAGHVGLDPDGNASIDLTDSSDSVRERVDRMLAGEKEDAEAAKAAEAKDSTKRGK
jgi:hypothetical protein